MNQYISNESFLDNNFFYYTDPNFAPPKKCNKKIPYPNEQDNGGRFLNEVDKPNTFRFRHSEIDFIKNLDYYDKKNNCRVNYKPISKPISKPIAKPIAKPITKHISKPIILDFQNDTILQNFLITFQDNKCISQETQSVSQESQSVSQESQSVSKESQSVSQESQSVSQESQSVSQESEIVVPKNIHYTVPQSFDTALYTAKLANIIPEKLVSNNFNEQIIFDRSYIHKKNKRTFIDDFIENENLIITIIFVILCFYIFR
jgi:hypothetical protein